MKSYIKLKNIEKNLEDYSFDSENMNKEYLAYLIAVRDKKNSFQSQ